MTVTSGSPWRAAVVAAVLAAGALAGCGAKPPVDENRSSISGVVTLAGTPLRAGTITFDSTEKGISTSTSIAQDGRYGSNRVPLGANIVTIETESLQYGSPHLYTRIPGRYADPTKSGFTIEVKPGKNENVDFALKP